jgi:hypothetical protein
MSRGREDERGAAAEVDHAERAERLLRRMEEVKVVDKRSLPLGRPTLALTINHVLLAESLERVMNSVKTA